MPFSKPLKDQLLTVVHDEHTADIKLDVGRLLLCVKEVKWSPLENKENSLELKLTLHREVFPSRLFLPVISEALVKSSTRFLGNFFINFFHLAFIILPLLGFLLLILLIIDNFPTRVKDPQPFVIEAYNVPWKGFLQGLHCTSTRVKDPHNLRQHFLN